MGMHLQANHDCSTRTLSCCVPYFVPTGDPVMRYLDGYT
jgi:hypothetical protein